MNKANWEHSILEYFWVWYLMGNSVLSLYDEMGTGSVSSHPKSVTNMEKGSMLLLFLFFPLNLLLNFLHFSYIYLKW